MARAFAKPAFDIGFATNDIDGFATLWEKQAGLSYDHLAKLGSGFHQHRWRQGDSIIKVNHTRQPLPDAPAAGYRLVTLEHRRFKLNRSRDQFAGQDALTHRFRADPDPNGSGSALAANRQADLVTPDGVPVSLREDAGADLTLHVVANDLDAFARFYGGLLGLAPDGANAFRLGGSRIETEAGSVPEAPGWREKGLRYMTVQIFDCDGLTVEMERQGAVIGAEPRTIGQVRYSFVRDSDGNWIELSERASLTGKPVAAG